MAVPTFALEWSPTTDPAATPVWVDISSRLRWFELIRGKQHERGQVAYGEFRARIDNADRAFDPNHTGSPYYPNVVPIRQLRFSMTIGGTTYRLFRGDIERYPRARKGNTWSEVELVAHDAFAAFAIATITGTLPQELSGARTNRVFDLISWPAADRDIDAGQSLVQAVTFALEDDQKALAHLQDIEKSELGFLFMSGSGFPVLIDRHALLKAPYTQSQATFSDKPTGAELPYADIQPSSDDDLLINDWIGQRTGGTVQRAQDATSITRFRQRSNKIDTLLTSDAEQLNQVQYLLSKTKDPQQRFEAVLVRPGDRTDVWQQVLGRELADRITLKENPPGGGAVNVQNAHIQRIHLMSGEALEDLGCEWGLYPAGLADALVHDDAVVGIHDSDSRHVY